VTKSDPLRLEEHEIEPDSDWLEIGNEFAVVRVRRVRTRNGARLQIDAPKRELSVFLDATVLDALTWQTSASMSAFLETPLEPLQPPSRE
jgi:hypothetical protein